MPSITISDMRVAYNNGKTLALSDFNLRIEDGEFCVLLGPSGCGKTTVLHCIAGLIKPDSGEIRIGENVVTSAEKRVFLRPQERNIAMVFQEYALYPNMTVRGNLSFALETMNKARSEIQAKVEQTAQMLGIEGLLDRKPAELSGGQRQRVALGRALVRDPQVFLLDEPLGNLDAKLRDQVRYELRKLQLSLGVTTVYVTHDQTEAMTLADRIVLMKDGRVLQEGTPRELYSEPKNLFVAGFVGTPQINLTRCSVRRQADGSGLLLSSNCRSLPVPQKTAACLLASGRDEVIVGIRPADFQIARESGPFSLDGRVEVVEPLGDAVLVYLAIGEHMMVAKLTEMAEDEVGASLSLTVDPARIHIFDPVTEERIG